MTILSLTLKQLYYFYNCMQSQAPTHKTHVFNAACETNKLKELMFNNVIHTLAQNHTSSWSDIHPAKSTSFPILASKSAAKHATPDREYIDIALCAAMEIKSE